MRLNTAECADGNASTGKVAAKGWGLPLVSIVWAFIAPAVVFGLFSPTAGTTQWVGLLISFTALSACVVCLFLSPRRPIAPRVAVSAVAVLPLVSLLFCWCFPRPKLSAEDRRQDIAFLAQWARDCSPLVTLNEKYKGIPSYEALKSRYLEFAEKAESNEEFYRVASAYYNVIAASGHAGLLDESFLKWTAVGSCLGIWDWGISPRRLWAGTYWSKVARENSTRAHPPFRIVAGPGGYQTAQHWQHEGIQVPRGSSLLKVNGMTCPQYLDYIKSHSSLRYDAFAKDWVDKYLLVIDEGPQFRGWNVDFRLPSGSTLQVFVPKVPGFPAEIGKVASVDAKENCTCLELADKVAYVRVKEMWRGPLSYVSKGYMKKERDLIREFFERGQGKYEKVIIDIRNNGGGFPEYVYDNLICPFLKEPLTFKQVVGVRKKYLQNTDPFVLEQLKKQDAKYIVAKREIKPPDGFPENDWVFYEITRQISPAERYRFQGKLYVLVNDGCWSAADDYADLVKRTKLGVVVGQNTSGGGGAYLTPGVIRLPRSGMIFRVETEILLTPNGQVDELFGTEPDVKLPPADLPKSITREDLLNDPWIKHVLSL